MENREGLYRYEDILRAIGRYIDMNNIQDVILLQSEDGILLRGYRPAAAGRHGPALIQYLFTPADLQAIDEEARQRRGTGSPLLG
ncbi:hypothetical protein [Sphaerobacter thermophilus]|uniref:hypothetical protein n=1 Tax=Sphaerobacter thermophilus TaxID=2057 RepID=UPI002357AB24